MLSVPLSSGQWLQLRVRFFARRKEKSLSVPLSSGQWLQHECTDDCVKRLVLSVPLSSGQWLQLKKFAEKKGGRMSFSPLVIGSMAATRPGALR